MSFEITADSWPDFDNWGWDDSWSSTDWITWHTAMKNEYGPQHANSKVLDAYESINYLLTGFGASEAEYALSHENFRSYFDGIDFNGTSILELMLSHVMGGQLMDSVNTGLTTIGGAASAAASTVTGTVKALPWLIAILVIAVAYNVANNKKGLPIIG